MIGTIDEHSRAFVDVLVRSHPDSVPVPVAVWIDTAFDGHLVFPMPMILQLQLEALAETDAILADGSQTTLETFLCYVDWFGDRVPLPVIANDGRFPLLGTAMLDRKIVHLDYVARSLTID